MKALKMFVKPVLITLAAYLIFAIVTSTVPYLATKRISVESARVIDGTDYYGNADGPDRAAVIEDPESAMSVRLHLIREAAETLDVTYHVFRSGDCTDAFLGELLLAADRGVEVRVLADGKTSLLNRDGLRAVSAHPNISCREYNPINLLAPWRWHSLLHDKFIIADGEYLLLGGRNIDDRHYAPEGYNLAVTHDRDVLVWRSRPSPADNPSAVGQVTEYMNRLWDYEHTYEMRTMSAKKTAKELAHLYSSAEAFEAANGRFYARTLADFKDLTVETRKITLLSNPIEAQKKEPIVAYALKRLSESANSSVVVQTPYATGNRDLLDTLTEISSGAKLTVVTNSALSSPNLLAFSNYYCQREKFVATGAELYEYQMTDSIHGKSIIIDGQLSAVGSFNLDDRSMYIDTETMLVIDGEAFAAQLSAAVEDIRQGSLPVGPDNTYLTSAPSDASRGKYLVLRLVYILMRPFQRLL